jgi:triosephosphate isomerase (TIM)
MARKKFIAGNWKMYKNGGEARALATAVKAGLGNDDRVSVALCPPFPWLTTVAEVLKGSPIALGAQNVYPEPEGAFTGEISPRMLLDAGCQYVIVGHSERRTLLGEKDDFINAKVKFALKCGLQVIFCIGETLRDREANNTEAVLDNQITWGLRELPKDQVERLVIAYEPVWAINTGRIATPEQAQQAHVFVRWRFSQLYGNETAEALTIQYGGSAKPDNVNALLHQPDVDGALVGGGSLVADTFLAIIRLANP